MTSENSSRSFECISLSRSCTLQDIPVGVLGWHATVVSAIILVSVLGNALILVLVGRYKRLRCRSVIVSLSVIAGDLLFTVTYHIPILVSTIARRWTFTDKGCVAFSYLGQNFLLTRWLIMAVLSIDRFSNVRFPFSYQKYNKYVIITLTVIAWLLPTVLSIPSTVDGFASYSFRHTLPTCVAECLGERDCILYYIVVLSSAFMLGGILPTILYVWLYRRARRLRPSAVELGRISIQVASGALVNQPIAQLDGNSIEARALVTFGIILVTLFITGLPAYTSQAIRAASLSTWYKIPLEIHFIFIEVFLLSTALDPLVIMRDKDFRHCLKDLFCCGRRRTEPEPISRHSLPSITSNERETTAANGEFITANGTYTIPLENGGCTPNRQVVDLDSTSL